MTMINSYECKVGKLQAPFQLKLGAEALLAYDYFNHINLIDSGALPGIFKNTIYKYSSAYASNSSGLIRTFLGFVPSSGPTIPASSN